MISPNDWPLQAKDSFNHIKTSIYIVVERKKY